MVDLTRLIDRMSDDSIFEEIPVDIDTFMGPEYLDLDEYIQLGPLQKDIINYSTQIFDLPTLIAAYGEIPGRHIHRYTKTEVISMLGKGSGKDLCAEISCAYLVYKLLCMKDPAKFFGVPRGDAIDIVNVAVNADQAQRVFFKGFTNMIKNAPWFAGKVTAPKQRVYEFEKSVSVHSGHSEMEAFEGLNTIMVILDEISAFAMTAAQGAATDLSPAQATYNMYRASLTSRFPENGKLVLLSWPRHKGDFISTRYKEVVGTIDVTERSADLAINPAFPIDSPGNKLTIEWTEDHIVEYKEPGVWALRRPSWEVNPKRSIENYKADFIKNYRDALGRFAAQPTDGSEGFFSDHEALDRVMQRRNGVNEDTGLFEKWFQPRQDREYFIHVDLAQKHDRAVVAIAHVDHWKYTEIFAGQFENSPYIEVDAYKYWTPTKEQQISFLDVKNFILDVARRGFNVRLVTFDQWNSTDMINYLNEVGMRAEKQSVGLDEYLDLKLLVAEQRVKIPFSEILKTEFQQLKITKNGKNVDHPSTGSKDIADAVAGAVYNAISRAVSDEADDNEVLTLDDIHAKLAEQYREDDREEAKRRRNPTYLKRPPPLPVADDEWDVAVL